MVSNIELHGNCAKAILETVAFFVDNSTLNINEEIESENKSGILLSHHPNTKEILFSLFDMGVKSTLITENCFVKYYNGILTFDY